MLFVSKKDCNTSYSPRHFDKANSIVVTDPLRHCWKSFDSMVLRLGVILIHPGLLNTRIVPVVGHRRSKKRSSFESSAA